MVKQDIVGSFKEYFVSLMNNTMVIFSLKIYWTFENNSVDQEDMMQNAT